MSVRLCSHGDQGPADPPGVVLVLIHLAGVALLLSRADSGAIVARRNSVVLMEPMIGSTILLTLKPNNFPSCSSGLAKIIPSIGPVLTTLRVVPRLHNNILEELIIHELFLMFCPVISELGNLEIELSNGVSSEQKGSTLSGSQAKVLLEEVHRILTSSHWVGMTLFPGGLVRPEPGARLAI